MADPVLGADGPPAVAATQKVFADLARQQEQKEIEEEEKFLAAARLYPATRFCWRYNLTHGVLAIAFFHLVCSVAFVCSIDSTRSITFLGSLEVSAEAQIWFGTWFLFGIPVIIGGAIGVIHKVEVQLRRYYRYLVANTFFVFLHVFGAVWSGSLCRATVSPYLRELTNVLVCGSTNALAIFWIIVGVFVSLYFAWIVWSAAEEVQMSFFPELEAHLLKLEAERKKGYETMAPPRPAKNLKPSDGADAKTLLATFGDDEHFRKKMAKMQTVHKMVDKYGQDPDHHDMIAQILDGSDSEDEGGKVVQV